MIAPSVTNTVLAVALSEVCAEKKVTKNRNMNKNKLLHPLIKYKSKDKKCFLQAKSRFFFKSICVLTTNLIIINNTNKRSLKIFFLISYYPFQYVQN